MQSQELNSVFPSQILYSFTTLQLPPKKKKKIKKEREKKKKM